MGYTSDSRITDAINHMNVDLMGFAYQKVAKKAFFAMDPDKAHSQMISMSRKMGRIAPLMRLLRLMIDYTDPVLETSVAGVDFSNPFGLSAGLDKNCDLPVLLDNAGFGFETVGSTTARPCPGNPRPWFHRLPQYNSMVVHAGLANDGSHIVMQRVEKAAQKSKTMRMSVSIARTNDDLCGDIKEGIEDYAISFRRAADITDMIEINISCPNTRIGEPFSEPENLDRLFSALDEIDRKQPVFVKMPLNMSWQHFKQLADVLAEHNVQGLSIANLQKNREGLDVPADWKGGLSGLPCLKDSDRRIAQTYKEYGSRFVVAGIGGVFSPEQAYRKIRNGASLIMFISSLMYLGPQNISKLKRGLAGLLKRDGFQSVSQAVGIDVK